MTDYGYVFSKELQRKIKERVFAKVFVRSTADDKLEVIITGKSGEDWEFKRYIYDFSNKIVHGYSTDFAAYEILESFKKFIIGRYFIKEKTH